MDRLNYFTPYESKTAWHEDQLTRAFLVLLRLVPMVHASFLDVVRDTQIKRGSENIIPPLTALTSDSVTIETQVSAIPQSTGRLISIVMTDEHVQPSMDICASDRGARFDGVLCYRPDWILIIENKPSALNVWPDQLNPVLPKTHEITIDNVLVDIPWRSLIERMTFLLSRKLLQGTEAMLVDDFLRFVDQQFPTLNPSTRFSLCKENQYLLTKRCRAILEELAPSRVHYHRGSNDYIRLSEGPAKQLFFYPRSDEKKDYHISLEIYPGDTIRQALEFFKRVRKEDFLALTDNGWSVWPNMHFAYMSTNLSWSKTRLAPREYFEYWCIRQDMIRQIPRDSTGFHSYFQRLLADGILLENDLTTLDMHFTATKRNALNPCPGFGLSFSWSLAKAGQLDSKGIFVEALASKSTEALSTWQQNLVER